MASSTGFPRADAADDFARARRAAAMARLRGWLRGLPEGEGTAISFDEMLEALGRRGQRVLGTRLIPIDAIVGSVDRGREFDADFRPTTAHSRARWERVAEGLRRGVSLPPIEVYQVGGLYFVQDGHHRVSAARALGQTEIEAEVVEVSTTVSGRGVRTHSDLQLRMFQRVLYERVPLEVDALRKLQVCEPRSLATLAEGIEAWATRTMLAEGQLMDRATIARRWFAEEYAVVAGLITEAGLVGPDEHLADAYLRLSCERYWICRCHTWSDEIVRSLLQRH